MAVQGTKTYMNWINVAVTPMTSGAQAIAIKSVTAVRPIRTNKIKKFYGDNRAMARVVKSVERERGVTIMTGDVAALIAIPEDTPCIVTATLLDPRNGATPGGGAILFTLNNAILEKDESEGKNNEFAGGTVTFTSGSSDDSSGNEIDPMVVTYL